MKRFFFCIVVILTIAGVSSASGQTPPTEQSWIKLNDKVRIYLMIGKDLLDMAKAKANMKDFDESLTAIELHKAASEAHIYFSAATDLTFIYQMIDSIPDKDRVRPYINQQLNNYSTSIEFIIKEVNNNLSSLTTAGIAATGTRLRDELRDGQSLLKTSKVR
ncbi:MAG: hypothetical protein V1715_04480 [bacterium]